MYDDGLSRAGADLLFVWLGVVLVLRQYTTAFAAGFDPAFCSKSCDRTRLSPYFNSDSRRPYRDFGWRPTMSIAALDLKRARQLIDRGAAAGRSAALRNKRDVMFYFIGAAQVGELDSNRFLPGALGDHLTSFGGDLTGTLQMSSLRWLEAGATGSYGTVVEPCNLPGKFPHVGLLMRRYLGGETLLEAYWKSVAMPGQGSFIGDPLARPYAARGASLQVASW